MKAINIQNNEWTILDKDSNLVTTVFCNENNNTEQGALDAYNEALNPSQEMIEVIEAQDEKDRLVSEAKAYLNDTDYKVLPDYDGNTEGIMEARAEARATIRSIEAE